MDRFPSLVNLLTEGEKRELRRRAREEHTEELPQTRRRLSRESDPWADFEEYGSDGAP